ncbi:MAG: DinB family protein [Chloroflexi bacterium]|nr:DinB family protein [Chloroflexota bacterium]
MSEAQRIGNQLKRYFVEKTGVFLPFNAAVEGLTAAQSLLVPRQKFNSIWGVVNHVCYWQEASLLLIQGSPKMPETPGEKSGGWFAPTQAADDEWHALVTRTLDMNVQLADALAALDEDALHKKNAVWKQTPYEIALSILTHNSYHTCEIITLRHLQGLWVAA